MIIRLIENDGKQIFSPNLHSVYMIRAAERILKYLPSISAGATGIWGTGTYFGKLTLGDIYLGGVELTSFTFNCQLFMGQPFSLHSLFGDIDFNPSLAFNKDEPISFLFRSKHLHFNLTRTIVERVEPYGHILNKGFYIQEVIVTKKKIEVLG